MKLSVPSPSTARYILQAAAILTSAARGKTPTAFDRRCITAGLLLLIAHISSNMLALRALPAARLTALGATRESYHGLLCFAPCRSLQVPWCSPRLPRQPPSRPLPARPPRAGPPATPPRSPRTSCTASSRSAWTKRPTSTGDWTRRSGARRRSSTRSPSRSRPKASPQPSGRLSACSTTRAPCISASKRSTRSPAAWSPPRCAATRPACSTRTTSSSSSTRSRTAARATCSSSVRWAPSWSSRSRKRAKAASAAPTVRTST